MLLKITIPCKAYTKKFLQFHVGANYKLSKQDVFGRHLTQLMRSPLNEKRYETFLDRYTAGWEITFSPNNFFNQGLATTAQTTVDFNSFVESLIKTELHAFVDMARSLGVMQAKAIRQFMVKYDFQEEDIPYDTLKKSYTRYWATLTEAQKEAIAKGMQQYA